MRILFPLLLLLVVNEPLRMHDSKHAINRSKEPGRGRYPGSLLLKWTLLACCTPSHDNLFDEGD